MSTSDPSLWDREAPGFDATPDHGLADPDVRAAWRDLLLGALPAPPARVADVGCGTGALALLLAEQGFAVDALDFSPAMVRLTTAKVSTAPAPVRRLVSVREGDAVDPGLAPASVDVVLSRHVLWALADPAAVVRRWTAALRPRGRLVLVEGSWSTGAGLTAQKCGEMVEETCRAVPVTARKIQGAAEVSAPRENNRVVTGTARKTRGPGGRARGSGRRLRVSLRRPPGTAV